MTITFIFLFNSILLGIGLAMDAFSVSLANGLNEPEMKKSRMHLISGTFGFFQTLMPLIGWICVHTITQYFTSFQKFVPWIALILLLFIGGKMLIEGIKNLKGEGEYEAAPVSFGALMLQAVATSIDALSVGFTIADLDLGMAVVSTLMIGAVTYAISLAGVVIGRKFGTKLSGKANILGGAILIFIGLEIFVRGVLL